MQPYTTPLKYGLIAGIIMIAILMLFYIISAESLATFWPLVVYLPLIFLMIWGGITYRKELGGYQGFFQAFLAVLLISVVATVLFDTFGLILYKFIDPDLPDLIKKKVIEHTATMMEKFGTPDSKIDETVQQMKAQNYAPTIKSQLSRYATSIAIGIFFSLVIASFVRRPDQQPPLKTEDDAN